MTHTLALGAKLSSGARLGSRTLGLLRLSFASNVWISRRSRGTFTSEASGGVLTESSGSTGSSEALVDVDAASFSSSGGLIALVTHALWLPIDQGALGVGRTEDVGTGTCQMAVKEMMSGHNTIVLSPQNTNLNMQGTYFHILLLGWAQGRRRIFQRYKRHCRDSRCCVDRSSR